MSRFDDEGLDLPTQKQLGDFLAKQGDMSDADFLDMRADIQTKEQVNGLMFFEIVGHPNLFNSAVARTIKSSLLRMSIGFKGKRSDLVAMILTGTQLQEKKKVRRGFLGFKTEEVTEE